MALVRAVFGEGRMVEEATWQAVFLIPKGKGGYCGIGLVEVVWKVVAAIISRQLTASIAYHDFLHGFRAGRFRGTATLEDKMLQHSAAMREEVLYVIFLDLHTAHDTLYRDICLEIMEGFGVGTRALCILWTYWDRLRMVARAGGYYGNSFNGFRGVTQGGPLLTTIFNVVVDTVVWH